jgi:hypothetical protein
MKASGSNSIGSNELVMVACSEAQRCSSNFGSGRRFMIMSLENSSVNQCVYAGLPARENERRPVSSQVRQDARSIPVAGLF